MYPSTNTRSGPTTSTKATTTSISTSPYVTQTNFIITIFNTIKCLIANFYDKHAKKDSNSKETIAYQDAKFDTKFEKQVNTLSPHMK